MIVTTRLSSIRPFGMAKRLSTEPRCVCVHVVPLLLCIVFLRWWYVVIKRKKCIFEKGEAGGVLFGLSNSDTEWAVLWSSTDQLGKAWASNHSGPWKAIYVKISFSICWLPPALLRCLGCFQYVNIWYWNCNGPSLPFAYNLVEQENIKLMMTERMKNTSQ